MIYFKYILQLSLISQLLIVSLNCCSTPKIKPKPETGQWEICPLCKGTGIAEIYTDKPSSVDNKDIEEIREAKGCLSGPLFFHNDEVNSFKENEEADKKKRDIGKIEDEYVLEENIPTRAMRKRKIKCYRCKGTGWLRSDESPDDSNFTDEYKYESLKKLNEDIDK